MVMVKMNLDFAETFAAETRQRIHMPRLVLIDRVEKRVTWWPAVAVAKLAE